MILTTGPYPLTSYPWGRAQRQVLRQWMSAAMWYGMWAVPVIGFGLIVLTVVAPGIGNILGDATAAYVGAIFAVIFVLMARKRNADIAAAFNASAFRAGRFRAAIADDGLHLNSENVQQIYAWHAISEVRDGPDGLLVMLGPLVFLPLPASAFESNAALLTFRSALEARLAAKGAT